MYVHFKKKCYDIFKYFLQQCTLGYVQALGGQARSSKGLDPLGEISINAVLLHKLTGA